MTGQLTLDALRRALRYDPQTGDLIWLVSRGKAKAGALAACLDSRGYLVVGIGGKRHYAHRLAWWLAHSALPEGVIDHINGDKGDNRLANLRCVSVQVNAQNRRRVAARSKTQVLGVSPFAGKFRAALSVDGQNRHLGTFPTLEQAQQAYIQAKRQLHEGCTL